MEKIIQKVCLLWFIVMSISTFGQQADNWWNKTVFYELMVRSFYDSNGNGTGDFNGLVNKFDYLNDGDSTTHSDLGIGGIWLMPINSSPSYHGYDVTDYKSAKSTYGSNAEFKNMVNEAHKRGIKVIIDFVINHSSSSHPWFTKSVNNDPHFRNFYRWSSTKPTYKGPWGQELWYLRNGSYYYALFWDGMPDLNYEYAPVKDSIYSAAKFWIDSMKVDGFRLDAAMYLYESGNSLLNRPETIQFWSDFNAYCKTLSPNFMTLGEVWESTDNIKKYNGKLDQCFEFNIATSILNAFKNGNSADLGSKVQYAYDNLNINRYSTFLTNHDQNRVFDEFGGNLSKMKAAASVYLTLPGNPFLYYGEEIGMKGSKPDENLRSPMQWSAEAKAGFTTGTPWQTINSNFTTYNVESFNQDGSSILNHYKNLIRIRNRFPALQNGLYQKITVSNSAVFSFIRTVEDQKILVLVNTSANPINNLSINAVPLTLADGNYAYTNLINYSSEQLTISNNTGTGISLGALESKVLYLGTVASLDPSFSKTEFSIYPNPASASIGIEVNFGSKEVSNIEFYDAFGKLQKVEKLYPFQVNTYSIKDFTVGIYYIKFQNGKTAKFLKQ